MKLTTSSPKYASAESLQFQLWKKQQSRKKRIKNNAPLIRYFRRNKGTTDGYETNARLIPDPLTHFDVEFQLLGAVDPAGTFLAQSISVDSGSREFQLYQKNGTLIVVLGGYSNGTITTLTTGVWRVKFDGVNIEIFKDGVSVETIAAVVGAATEPSATFTMCARHAGTNSSYGFHYEGVMANVRVRNSSGEIAHSYPLDEPKGTSTIYDIVGGNNGAIINGNDEDKGLFTQQPNGDWLGEELVVNGGFDTDSDWLKGEGWSIAGGIAVGTMLDSFTKTIRQSVPIYEERVYKIRYNGTADSGAFGMQNTSQQVEEGFQITPLNNSVVQESSGFDVVLFKRQTNVSSATLDNVSVKELLKSA